MNAKQIAAVELVACGKDDREVAKTIGKTARQTVNLWRNHNPDFIAAVNERRQEIYRVSRERLQALTLKAVDTLEPSLEEGSLKAALAVLKIVENLPPPEGATDPLAVEAEQNVEKDIAERPPDPVMDSLLNHDELIFDEYQRLKSERGN